jgi:hypothetical protein
MKCIANFSGLSTGMLTAHGARLTAHGKLPIVEFGFSCSALSLEPCTLRPLVDGNLFMNYIANN